MFKRYAAATVLFGSLALLAATAAFPSGSAPSGQRMFGNTSFDSTAGVFTGGGGTIEPAYDAATGTLVYLSTPNNAHVNLNAPLDAGTGMPKNVAPIYLPVYPVGSGIEPATLNCAHVPADNCADPGPLVAGAVMGIDPAVYGGGVLGHDHLVGIAKTGGDFNVLWEPVLVLFTTKGCATTDPTCNATTHITTLDQINAAVTAGTAFEVKLPALTFHCASVSAAAYWRATPAPTVVGP
jgi:hypothetical protein